MKVCTCTKKYIQISQIKDEALCNFLAMLFSIYSMQHKLERRPGHFNKGVYLWSLPVLFI